MILSSNAFAANSANLAGTWKAKKYLEWGLRDGKVEKVLITPKGSLAANYGFDVTPAKYITGLITERGICKAKEKDILNLYPDHK